MPSDISIEDRFPYFRDASKMHFPENFPIIFTNSEFPINYKDYNEIGIPLGLIVNPFIGKSDGSHLYELVFFNKSFLF